MRKDNIMEDLKKLVEKMYKEMEADLARSGDLEEYGEDGIRLAIYEDLKDSLNYMFSDVIY